MAAIAGDVPVRTEVIAKAKPPTRERGARGELHRSATRPGRRSAISTLRKSRSATKRLTRRGPPDGGELRRSNPGSLAEWLTLAATDDASSLAAVYAGLMTKTPPTKPPLRERLKLPDNCVDVTGQHKGDVFVLTGYGTHDGSARGAWIKKDELSKVLPSASIQKK